MARLRSRGSVLLLAWMFLSALGHRSSVMAGERRPLPKFDRVVIDADFPGGYQVEVADVDGDRKPDIVALGGGTCAWYQNPSWKKRIITTPRQTPGIISSATADLDGDGKAEVAIAYEFDVNRPTKGKLGLASPGKVKDDPWTFRAVRDIGSIHRLRWGDCDGDGRLDLVIAPIFGPKARPPAFDQDPALLLLVRTEVRSGTRLWTPRLLGASPVMHAIDVLDSDGDGVAEILTAHRRGVTRFARHPALGDALLPEILADGADNPGASEVHLGRLADGRRVLATVEPWHGPRVVARLSDRPGSYAFGDAVVIDDSLDDGHGLWVVDVDGDGDDEVFAGHRGKDHRVSAYDFDGKTWNRTVLDRDVAAQDLRGGDLDGDGTPDVVAIGGGTHNIVWYRPKAR